jgi:hypothetical protein
MGESRVDQLFVVAGGGKPRPYDARGANGGLRSWPASCQSATGSEVSKPIATPVLGGMLSSLVHVLIVTPVSWTTLKEWDLRKGRLGIGPKKVA